MAELLSKTVNIVLVGDFNPSIFQPAWLKSQGLISEAEANPTGLIVTPEVSSFSLPWLSLRVIHQQFVATSTKESHFGVLRDLVVGIFRLLQHTPIRQMGINLEHHYRFESEQDWNRFGDALAPKQVWRGFMKDPGLSDLSMVDKSPRETPPGTVRIHLRGVMPLGVVLQVNEHIDSPAQSAPGASAMVEILQKFFDTSLNDSQQKIARVLNAGETTTT